MKYVIAMICTIGVTAACAPLNSPTMMNTEKVVVHQETAIEQIPVGQINGAVLAQLAEDYHRSGAGDLTLTMVYDPTSSNFTAMKALHKVHEIEGLLKNKGVRSVITNTLALEGGEPALMISYDSLTAMAPRDCVPMPGIDDNVTQRDMGAYRFGCSTDTLFARQIARPADIMGNDKLEGVDGRRTANTLNEHEAYRAATTTQQLDTFGTME